MKTPYRVVQWSSGNVGRRALPAIVEHPELELVGLYAHSTDKVGKDAGEIAGIELTGIIATDDVDALVAERPDCVLYSPIRMDSNLVQRLLRAGINVVTTCGCLTGTNLPPGQREALDAAAREGGATFLDTGFNPGFANALTGFLTGICRNVYSVSLSESADCSTRARPEVWKAVGFAQPPKSQLSGPILIESDSTSLLSTFFDSLDLIAGMLELTLEKKEAFLEEAVATRDIDLGWIQFPKGTVAGQRRSYLGHAEGRVVVTLTFCWTMSYDSLSPQWTDAQGYRIEIEGEPRVDAAINFEPSRVPALSHETDVMSVLVLGAAMAALHAIPFVCDARPGMMTIAELPVFGARYAVV